MLDLDLNSVDSMVDIIGHWTVSNGQQAHLVDLVLALPVLIRPHETLSTDAKHLQEDMRKTLHKA